MKVIAEEYGCKLISPKLITDNRGWFQVSFNKSLLEKLNINFQEVQQLNHSLTDKKGMVRGLNFQEDPYEQAKIIRCTSGALFSVAVNISRMSSMFGKWCGFVLSAENKNLMYVPRGYAHGFVTLQDNTELEYFTDNLYSFEHAKSIRFDDPQIGIDWTLGGQIILNTDELSDKNRKAHLLVEYIKEAQ